MRTHNDVVQRAAFRVGLKRAGQDLDGPTYKELLDALEDFLLELNEDHGLDFDPLDSDSIPEERMGTLVPLFMYQPVFDQFDLRRSAGDRELLAERKKRQFFAGIIGDSDFVPIEPRDY